MSVYRTNMITTRDKRLLIASNSDLFINKADFNIWEDSAQHLWNWTGAADKFNLQTKDIDFGNPSRRKKIYKVYVTFKAGGYMSGVIAKYATNGSNSFTGTFNDTTYYSASKGFDSFNYVSGGYPQSNSTADWITVALKPTSTLPVSKIYSMQLKFEYADAGRMGYKVGATTDASDHNAAGTSKIKLDSGAHGYSNHYRGMPLFIFQGAGYGPDYRVTAYDSTTKIATVDFVGDGNLTDTNDEIATGYGVSTTSSYFDVGFIPKQFEINDISIVYREKPIK